MENNVNANENENKKVDERSHWDKHKKKYIIGGLVTLGFVAGWALGNRGNSKHHYSRLLKDGVRDAVEEGMRDVVQESMNHVVKDGMKRVVNDVVVDVATDATRHVERHISSTVKDTVDSAVKRALKESAVTVINAVDISSESKSEKDSNTEYVKKLLEYLNKDDEGLKFTYDSDGNIYKVKSSL